jgi:putative ABC transport system permease protein
VFSSRVPNGVRRLLRLPRSRRRLLEELDGEMRAHLALRVEHLRARGMSEVDAEAEALRRFGDTDEYRIYSARRADTRARWHRVADTVDEWLRDVRFAQRQFGRHLGFTALAVLTLALGIGANTAIFTVVHRLLIAPLPYPDGNRIVRLMAGEGANFGTPVAPLLKVWQARAHSLEMIAAVNVYAIVAQDFGEQHDSIHAAITPNYLDLLGLRPALGRGFTPDEERPGAPPVAMISYGTWQRLYGGRRDVLGMMIRVPAIEGRQYAVIGVTPPEMGIPMSTGQGVGGKLRQATPGIWLPASLDSLGEDDRFAKLRPGISAAAASRELQAILDSLPRSGATPARVRAMRAQDFLDPREMQTVEVLFVAVGVLLLIACANVANLLMSRAWTRRREFAVRTALGAARTRLIRQVLTEAVLLALAGGLIGIGVAWLTLETIVALRPPSLEQLVGVKLEPGMLLWSAAISVVTGILFGSAPALFAGGRNPGDVLRSETRSASGTAVARRMRSTLIVLEIAMSLVLLVGAGLLVRSFVALQRMPLGFQPHGLVASDILVRIPRNWSADARVAKRNELLERLRAMPGVTEASVGMMPGLGWMALGGLETEPDASGQTRSIPESRTIFINPQYFRVAGMRLLQGRPPDSLTAPRGDGPVERSQEIVINSAMARRLWPKGNAIGARLRPSRKTSYSQTSTVVGVADDTRMPANRGIVGNMEIYQFLPSRLSWLPVLLRTTLSERDAVTAVRRVVADFDRSLKGGSESSGSAIVQSVTVGDTYVGESLAPTRFAMALLVAFSVIALILSAVGLYGVIAYSVTQRTREIGVRVALGADTRSVRWLVVRGGLQMTAIGVLVGTVTAAASTRVLSNLLYGVSPVDPVSFIGIAVLIVAIALAAAYAPARRATLIDPMEALRAD